MKVMSIIGVRPQIVKSASNLHLLEKDREIDSFRPICNNCLIEKKIGHISGVGVSHNYDGRS